jgi:hypothetical protein
MTTGGRSPPESEYTNVCELAVAVLKSMPAQMRRYESFRDAGRLCDQRRR